MADIAPVDRRILVVAAAVFALLMAFSARYGFQGDELYFLDCARHLSLSWTPIVNPVTTQTIGWPELVRTVTGTWDRLPPGQRANAVIFTADYEEAGAINELGRNLPRAVSGHNTVWWWGPGNPRASTVLAVLPAQPAAGVARLLAQLKGDFASVTVVTTLGNPDHVSGTLADGTVYLCRHPIEAWGKLWPSFRHYG
jgi:hypothetical protein